MMSVDYPGSETELTTGELEQIESALRHPAMAEMIEGYDVSPADSEYPYMIELYQLIPLREWSRPWVLIMVEEGEREVIAYDSQRAAERDLACGLDYLTAEYDDAYGSGKIDD